MGKQPFEVYRDWLGITDLERPLNYYQLLRVKKFEDDAAKVRGNFNRMNAHIRKFLPTSYADMAHRILDELTKAMLCLTDTRRKQEYDATLGRTGTVDTRHRTLEEILVLRKVLDPAQLAKAQNLAKAIGVDLRDAVMQQKEVNAEGIMQAYAESLGLAYVDLGELQLDETLIPKLPAVLARQHSCVPVLVDDEKVLIASPNPLRTDVEDEVRLRIGQPVRMVLCTPARIHEVINKYYPREAAAAQMGVTSAEPAATADGKTKKRGPDIDPVERKKKRRQITMVSFMLTFVAFSILGSLFTRWSIDWGPTLFYLAGFGLGAVAASIAWIRN
jgi:hypothetical protein